MTSNKNVILNASEIDNKLRRIAYQIYEANVNESEIILAGIDKNGYTLAEDLKIKLQSISSIKPIICKVTIDKEPIKSNKHIIKIR